jgi:hypothetical protein
MPEPKLEYTEYQSVLNLLNESSDTSYISDKGNTYGMQDNVYQELMKKEGKTLDTINNVIKYYKDNDYKNKEFVTMNFWEVLIRFNDIWLEMWDDVTSTAITGNINDTISFGSIIMKNDRPIYIGILIIIISIFMWFVIISD